MLAHPTIKAGMDFGVSGTLMSAPIWAPYLSAVNMVLTSVCAIVGLIVGLSTLYVRFYKRND